MEPTELDNALEELEIRMERLRSLYQQYFLGIEKVEPAVARKDVDRRIWLLRREQIRNTGKRFKLNVLVQRYNTYQQYWIRICREIDNGTYVRHLQRAQRLVGEQELLTIATRRRAGLFRRQNEEADQEASPDGTSHPRFGARADDGAADAVDPIEQIRQAVSESLDSSGPPPTGPDAAPGRKPLFRAPPAPRAGIGISPFDLELDELPSGLARAAPARAAANGPGPLTPPRPDPRSPVPPPRLARPQARSPSEPAREPSPPRPLPPPRSRLSQGLQPAPAPGAPNPPVTPPAVRAATPPAPRPGGNLSEQRLKELHTRLIDAKRSTRDPTTVSEEGLAASLRAAETKLREKHGSHRSIDFDIVIKDGKAVVKPIIR